MKSGEGPSSTLLFHFSSRLPIARIRYIAIANDQSRLGSDDDGQEPLNKIKFVAIVQARVPLFVEKSSQLLLTLNSLNKLS